MSEYDAGALREKYEQDAVPRWRRVPCPTCGVEAGEQCGKRPLGMPWGWNHVAPHTARKRAAAGAGVLR